MNSRTLLICCAAALLLGCGEEFVEGLVSPVGVGGAGGTGASAVHAGAQTVGGAAGAGGAAAGGGGTPSAGGAGGGSPGCPVGLPGPALVTVPGAGCMDATEVTRGDYLEFLLDWQQGDPLGCNGNTLTPNQLSSCNGHQAWPPPMSAYPWPVVCVDWCDASAYCEWAGKRLCTAAQWTAACSHGGAQSYPYGATQQPGACNTDTGLMHAAGTLASCEGGYRGLFDLVGNVTEWVDSCAGSDCEAYGGWNQQPDASCASSLFNPQLELNNTFATYGWGGGFRCCADATN